MFKGNNALELNTATMIVAVQEYLDKRAKDGCSPKVVTIAANTGTNSVIFRVSLEEAKDTG